MPYDMERIWLEARFVLLTTSRAGRPIGRSLAYPFSVCWLSFAPSPSILQVALPAILPWRGHVHSRTNTCWLGHLEKHNLLYLTSHRHSFMVVRLRFRTVNFFAGDLHTRGRSGSYMVSVQKRPDIPLDIFQVNDRLRWLVLEIDWTRLL